MLNTLRCIKNGLTDNHILLIWFFSLQKKNCNKVLKRIRNVFWVRYETSLAIFQPCKPHGFLLLDGDVEMRCWHTTDIASPDTRLMIRSRVKLITHTRHFVIHPYHFHSKYPGWSTNMSCKNSNNVSSEERMNKTHSHYMWPTVTSKWASSFSVHCRNWTKERPCTSCSAINYDPAKSNTPNCTNRNYLRVADE